MKVVTGVFINSKTVKGELRLFRRNDPSTVVDSHLTDQAEWERFLAAKDRLTARLESEISEDPDIGSAKREIIAWHKWVLADAILLDKVETLIDQGKPAVQAVREAGVFLREKLAEVDNEYVRERQYDVQDVMNRLMLELQDRELLPEETSGKYIFISERFLPSEVIALYKNQAKGFLCKEDSPFSHSAIIAQSLGIPYVVQIKEGFNQLQEGMEVAIDGDQRTIVIEPAKDRDQLHPGLDTLTSEMSLARAYQDELPEIRLTFSSLKEIEKAATIRQENVGLIRSEFLFLDEDVRLDVSAQQIVYEGIMTLLAGREVVIRTFDYRGEKQAKGGGKGGVDPDLMLKIQLEALYKASSCGKLKIMFPLVSDQIQAEKCLRIARNIKQELSLKGYPKLEAVELGAMIETRDAVKRIPMIAPLFRFVALGTNDILESITAKRRDQMVNTGGDIPQFKELRSLISSAASACKRLAIPIGICGLYAEDPRNHDFFKEAGISYVSVSSAALINAYHQEND